MVDWVDCAVLAQPKGMEGRLACRAAAGLPFLLEEGMECALVPPRLDAPRRVTVAEVGPLAQGREALVAFREVADRAVAEAIAGCHCLVRASSLPLGDEALQAVAGPRWEGLEVVDATLGPVGVVEGIEQAPGQARLAVRRPDGSQALVPLVEELVLSVDEAAGRVDVSLPAGLLDL